MIKFRKHKDKFGFTYNWTLELDFRFIDIKIDKTGIEYARPPRYTWKILLFKEWKKGFI